MQSISTLTKEKYLNTSDVYNNFVAIHANLGLLEPTPRDWEGKTVEDAIKYLGIKDKGIRIKTPVDEIAIYKNHMEHLIHDNDPNRKKHLNRAIRTMQEPNIVVKNGIYNYYIKLFVDNDNIKPHLQVVKVKSDGSFYVTNHKLNKKQADKIILEGQVIYDLSSLSSTKVPTL